MRQIVLDTETTGLSTAEGHRIIEIGCIELVNRRFTGREYHRYLNPERDIDEGAERVHGISIQHLADQPLFKDVADELVHFLDGAELVIHNAEFDVGFLEHELSLMKYPHALLDKVSVLDTLGLAREMHPGQRNSLDALCKRYEVDSSGRDLHGALIDADLLARVYLAMTGGQAALSLGADEEQHSVETIGADAFQRPPGLKLVVPRPTATEIALHEGFLDEIEAKGSCVWRQPDATAANVRENQ